MDSLTPTSMERILNGEVEHRVSTCYDPFPPEERTGTEMNEEGP